MEAKFIYLGNIGLKNVQPHFNGIIKTTKALGY